MTTTNTTNTTTTTVKISTLLSTIISAASHGCRTIQTVQSSRATQSQTDDDVLSIRFKEEGEKISAVTVADLSAQRVVVNSLRTHWGDGLRVVGEEDETPSTGDLPPDDGVGLHLLSDLDLVFFNDGSSPQEFDDDDYGVVVPMEELTVYVDPLDGTREFIEGRLENVSCLVGVCRGGVPLCGAVAFPFVEGEGGGSCGGVRVAYGIVARGAGEMRLNGDGSVSSALRLRNRDDESDNNIGLKYTVGDSRPPIMLHLLKVFREVHPTATECEMGACGKKMISVAKGEMDVTFTKSNNCSWDTAAPSAVLLACGGKVTDWFGRPLAYKEGGGDYRNRTGVVASRKGFEGVHEEFCKRLREDEDYLMSLKK